ncbi:MAG: O-antigen ligase family protein [Candidatus Paceibacterota bacterium]|jgi:O-antigen ligase
MTTNKWLKYFIYAGIFVVPFIPWIVASSSYFPFITGKGFAFRVIVEIIFALWAILALRDKSARPEKSWLLYAVLTLGAVDVLATVFGLNPYRSFWSNYERMDGCITILHLVAYFVVMISVLKDRAMWFWLANTALVANIYIIAYGFLQLFGRAQVHQSAARLDASLGNSAYLAVYVLFIAFISAYLALLSWSKNKILATIYIILALLNVIVLYYTATRGAILGFVGGVFLACLLLAVFKSGQIRKIAGVIVALVILLVAGFYSIRNTDFVQKSQVLSRFADMSLSSGTAGSRLMIWKMSWQGFQERPILGWGPENYSMVFSKYYDPGMYGQEPWFDRSHNIFFDWLINAGILGLLAYLSIYLVSLYYLWFGKKKKEEKDFTDSIVAKSLLTGLFAAYFFHNIFVFDNLISYILFFSVIAFIHFLFSTKDEEKEKNLAVKKDYQVKKKNNGEIDIVATVGTISIIIVLIAGLYYLNYKPYQVSVNLIKAISPSQITRVEDSVKIFQQVFAANTFGSGEAREQLISKTMNILSDPQISNETKSAFVKLAEEQIMAHQAYFSDDARSNLFFGSYLAAIGQTDSGLTFLKKALLESPKKQQILFELGSTYIRKQDATNAVRIIKEAYELEPNYIEARKMYSLVCLMTGQNKLATDLLAPIKKTADYYNDERFLNLYQQMGNQVALQEIKTLREAVNKK